MTSLRIVQVLHKPQMRGGEVFVLQLSSELCQRGHEVLNVFLYGKGLDPRLPKGAEFRMLGGAERHPFETSLGFNPALLRRLCHVIDEFGPDIVQVNGGRTVKYGAFARQLRSKASWKLLYRNIGNPRDWIVGPRRRFLYGWIMRRIDGLAAISESSVRDLLPLTPSATPATVIPTGIDANALRAAARTGERQSWDSDPGGPVLLYVGSLSEEKRPERTLEVYSQVRASHPGVNLWLVGDGPLRGALEERARGLGIGAGVRFFGIRDDVGRFLNRASVLLLLSDTEGVPAVLLEAGLFGVPVVASRVGGIPECISDDETGMLVEPGDTTGAVRACRQLLDDRHLHARLGSAARSRVERQFTLDHIAVQFVNFYRDVVSGSDQSGGTQQGSRPSRMAAARP